MSPADDRTEPMPPWLHKAQIALRLGRVGGVASHDTRRIAWLILAALELDDGGRPAIVEANARVDIRWRRMPDEVAIVVYPDNPRAPGEFRAMLECWSKGQIVRSEWLTRAWVQAIREEVQKLLAQEYGRAK